MRGPRPHFSPSLENRIKIGWHPCGVAEFFRIPLAAKINKTGKVLSDITKEKLSLPVYVYNAKSKVLEYYFKGVIPLGALSLMAPKREAKNSLKIST